MALDSGDTDAALSELVAQLERLQPLEPRSAADFAASSGDRAGSVFTLGVRHGADGADAGRVGLRRQACPWSVQTADGSRSRSSSSKNGSGGHRSMSLHSHSSRYSQQHNGSHHGPRSSSHQGRHSRDGQREGLLRLGGGAQATPGDRIGAYVGRLVECDARGGGWTDTPCHLFVAVDAAFSTELDSPVFVVRQRRNDGIGSDAADSAVREPTASSASLAIPRDSTASPDGPMPLVVPQEPAVPTIAELVRVLRGAVDAPGTPLPTAMQAPLAVEEGAQVHAWTVADADLAALRLVRAEGPFGADGVGRSSSGLHLPQPPGMSSDGSLSGPHGVPAGVAMAGWESGDAVDRGHSGQQDHAIRDGQIEHEHHTDEHHHHAGGRVLKKVEGLFHRHQH